MSKITDTTVHINRRGTLKKQITRILNYTQDFKENIDIIPVKPRKKSTDKNIRVFRRSSSIDRRNYGLNRRKKIS